MAAKAAGEKLSKKEILLSAWRRIARNWGLYLLLLPAVALLFMFTYIPMYGIQIAFKDFTPKAGIEGSPWVGFEHFQTFFNSFQVKSLFTNTISLSLYSLIAGFPFPIFLALAIGSGKRRFLIASLVCRGLVLAGWFWLWTAIPSLWSWTETSCGAVGVTMVMGLIAGWQREDRDT